MQPGLPKHFELYVSFRQALGPRSVAAGLRVQFHVNQTPGVHFRVPVSEEYRASIVRGIQDGLALRYPHDSASACVWVTEVTQHEVDSSQQAFYRVARFLVEQAHALASPAT